MRRCFSKPRTLQLTGSFKFRGAMSKMSAHSAEGQLITASSGNHGIATALAARSLGKELIVVVPETVVPAKLEKIKAYGVEVIMHGAEGGMAEQHAQQLSADKGYTYISPYNDFDIIAGQGTIGLEILEQCENVDNVFVSMGGGGLISGIGSVIKSYSPRTKIWGVSASNSMALAASMVAGYVVETVHTKTLADGVVGGMDFDSVTLPLATSVVDEAIDCDEAAIVVAFKALALDENMIVEGAAALALAGFNQVADRVANETSVIVLCGANHDQALILDKICGDH